MTNFREHVRFHRAASGIARRFRRDRVIAEMIARVLVGRTVAGSSAAVFGTARSVRRNRDRDTRLAAPGPRRLPQKAQGEALWIAGKEIDHFLRRVGAIEKHLGIHHNIAA